MHEQNKAERTKPAQTKTAARNEKSEKHAPAHESAQATDIEVNMQRLLASLPSRSPLSPEFKDHNITDKEKFLHDIDMLIGKLENHLAEWRKVRDLVK